MISLQRESHIFVLTIVLVAFLNPVAGWFWSGDVIKCYQCSSHDNLDCADNNIQDGSIKPLDCSHIHEAKYCVKTVGRNSGVYTTSRQCSSVDLGNYCDYIKLTGDVMDYRSCVYTCESDGCNAADSLARPSVGVLLLSVVALCTGMFLM